MFVAQVPGQKSDEGMIKLTKMFDCRILSMKYLGIKYAYTYAY